MGWKLESKVAGFRRLPKPDHGRSGQASGYRRPALGEAKVIKGVLYAIRLLKGRKVPSETLIDVALVSAPVEPGLRLNIMTIKFARSLGGVGHVAHGWGRMRLNLTQRFVSTCCA